MSNAVKYLVDEKGKKTSVLVPVQMWETLNESHRKLQAKVRVLTGIKAGLKEVEEAKKNGKKLQPLKDFLSEG